MPTHRRCSKCNQDKSQNAFCRDRDSWCKACMALAAASWRVRNPAKSAESCMRWRARNPLYVKRHHREENARRRATPEGRVIENMRRLINFGLKGAHKTSRAEQLLGCSFAKFRAHIESQFLSGMTWNNYGAVWELDHILPIAVFVLTHSEEQEVCFHWSNYQPLWVKDNRRKGALV